MAYEDRFAITKIIDQNRDNLSVSFDSGTRRFKENEVGAVLLYTPDMSNTSEHYHIELNRQEATLLKEWLEAFLNEKDPQQRYQQDLNFFVKEAVSKAKST
jgi:hypothetical protein